MPDQKPYKIKDKFLFYFSKEIAYYCCRNCFEIKGHSNICEKRSSDLNQVKSAFYKNLYRNLEPKESKMTFKDDTSKNFDINKIFVRNRMNAIDNHGII